jgi:hypothetical protein
MAWTQRSLACPACDCHSRRIGEDRQTKAALGFDTGGCLFLGWAVRWPRPAPKSTALLESNTPAHPFCSPPPSPRGLRYLVCLRYPRNAAPRERFAPSHRPLRAVPYGLPHAFLSFSFHGVVCCCLRFVRRPHWLAFVRGPTPPLKGTPAGRRSLARPFVKGD